MPVGIVTGGYPSCGMRIAVEGATAHTGPTPMGERHNALVGAAMVAVAVNDIGWAHADTDAKATAAGSTWCRTSPAPCRNMPNSSSTCGPRSSRRSRP